MSMLPEDTAARREGSAGNGLKQTTTKDTFKDTPIPVRYSDDGFRQLALEWMIATDQVSVKQLSNQINLIPLTLLQLLSAFEELTFKQMVNMASKATTQIKIPDQKLTRIEILRMFGEYMSELKTWLNVGPT